MASLAVSFSARRCLRVHCVGRKIRVCTQQQALRFHALRIIAAVPNNAALRHMSFESDEHESVGLVVASSAKAWGGSPIFRVPPSSPPDTAGFRRGWLFLSSRFNNHWQGNISSGTSLPDIPLIA